MGFTVTEVCCLTPFEPWALLVAPVVLWVTSPPPRPIELGLLAPPRPA